MQIHLPGHRRRAPRRPRPCPAAPPGPRRSARHGAARSAPGSRNCWRPGGRCAACSWDSAICSSNSAAASAVPVGAGLGGELRVHGGVLVGFALDRQLQAAGQDLPASPLGLRAAGLSITSSGWSRRKWAKACSVSWLAVSRNRRARSLLPSCLATSAKKRYLRLAMLSPPKAASRLAWVPGWEGSWHERGDPPSSQPPGWRGCPAHQVVGPRRSRPKERASQSFGGLFPFEPKRFWS